MAWDEENSMLVQMREGLDGCKGGLLIKKFDGDDMEAVRFRYFLPSSAHRL
jgi:hypothetical protein